MAQTITTIQAMNFGEAILTDNNAQHAITVRFNGNVTSDPEYIFIGGAPVRGIYEITGGVPMQRLDTVTVTVDQELLGGGGQFIIDDFDIQSPNRLNGAGEGTIRIGARIRSTGSGTPPPTSTTFNGLMTLDVTFQ